MGRLGRVTFHCHSEFISESMRQSQFAWLLKQVQHDAVESS